MRQMQAPEVIRSAQNARLKTVRALRRGRERERLLLEGARVIDEALQAGVQPQFLLHQEALGEVAQALVQAAAAAGIPCCACEAGLLAQEGDLDSPPGLLAVAARPQADLEEVFRHAARAPGLILVAAGIQDPGNGGALVRVAAGLGAAAVVFLHGSVSPWHPRAIRGASGTCFRLPVADAVPAARLIELANAHQIDMWGAVVQGEPAIAPTPPRPLALLLGEEGGGLDPALIDACSQLVCIPLQRGVESLNVATAAAVLVHLLA